MVNGKRQVLIEISLEAPGLEGGPSKKKHNPLGLGRGLLGICITHCLHTLHFQGEIRKTFPPATLSLMLESFCRKVLPIFWMSRMADLCMCVCLCLHANACVEVCVGWRMWPALIAFYWLCHALGTGGCRPGSLSKLFCGQLAFILLAILWPERLSPSRPTKLNLCPARSVLGFMCVLNFICFKWPQK